MRKAVQSGHGRNIRRNNLHLHVTQRRAVSERSRPTNQLIVIDERIKANLRRLHPGEQRVVIVVARRSDRFDRDDCLAQAVFQCRRQIDCRFEHLV